jgi:hypothetical protein
MLPPLNPLLNSRQIVQMNISINLSEERTRELLEILLDTEAKTPELQRTLEMIRNSLRRTLDNRPIMFVTPMQIRDPVRED